MIYTKLLTHPNRADDLRGAGIFDLLDLADDRLVYACADCTRSKLRACDLAHDAADDGVNGDFSAAAVVGEVMGKAEGFFTEGFGKFLLLFNFLGSSLFDMGRRKEQMFFMFVQSFTNGQIMGFGC